MASRFVTKSDSLFSFRCHVIAHFDEFWYDHCGQNGHCVNDENENSRVGIFALLMYIHTHTHTHTHRVIYTRTMNMRERKSNTERDGIPGSIKIERTNTHTLFVDSNSHLDVT